ncbi:ATP-binding cassette transporter sub-family H 88708-like protein [Leptotrombidium deliense]|uniref:ATP-binding cassette transporter sub-family H 88708-like protein n=1 Tax=Leptotrombidium deliense TaxID=299467 RepID=A0A443SGK8_9ACAR|nr:ATP-binding cassette transporter sub-family H 88708-like protein [Leptotrombidium deliense]
MGKHCANQPTQKEEEEDTRDTNVPIHVNDNEEFDNEAFTISHKYLTGVKKEDINNINGHLDGTLMLTYVDDEKEMNGLTDVEEPLVKHKFGLNISPSSVTKRKHECAVFISNVCYTFGKVVALRNVSSTIARGEIYGLLGPSGCGKTTLLRCIVGVTKPKSGEITVFGEKPGTAQSSVPGTGVGYMPQDIALYNEFTIGETIHYFGQIYGMSKDLRNKRIEFLIAFLDLPDANRQIQTLSGGQKRRASLAAALIHNPPLLILDEPTVGVDPLLRESIWHHLIELTRTENMTIIVTTHYIEEARKAYKVGLMRMGQLLVEDKPNNLITKYNANNLETVFLKVCEMAKNTPQVFEEQTKRSPIISREKMARIRMSGQNPLELRNSYNKIGALMNKGVLRLRRNVIELIFQTILPALQIMLFCLCIGQDPHDLDVAVYNPDQNYSLRFMKEIEPEYFNFINYSSFDGAVNAVKNGDTWAAITFDANYSLYLNQRFQLFANITNDTLSKKFPIQITIISQMLNASARFVQKLIEETPIQFSDQDTSFGTKVAKALLERNKSTVEALNALKMLLNVLPPNQFPYQNDSLSLLVSLLEKVSNNFAQDLLALDSIADELMLNKKAVSEPFLEIVQPPIYGTARPSFRDFAAPGLILGVTYILAVGLTALAFVIDRKGGQLERTLIAGVHPIHILIAHIVIQVAIILLQTAFLLFSVFVVFDIPLRGSIILVILLTLVQGISGMSFGFLISSFCKEEQLAILLAVASFYPNLILSGIFWPLEGMPTGLRYISYFMPQTLPIKALRSIISRGWGICLQISMSDDLVEVATHHEDHDKGYGLLGPSGCGKSTLLRSIVGIIRPKTGEITVFGVKPGSRHSFIPGPGVGYMPQEIALYNELTIQENINYYGRIYGLSKSVRKERFEFLIKFLDLPEANRKIRNLRFDKMNIEDFIELHLVIGLMRLGQLLVEDKPDNLLAKYNVNNLEDVFLKVCELSKQSPQLFSEKQIIENTENEAAHIELATPGRCKKHFNKISAVTIKGAKRIQRNKAKSFTVMYIYRELIFQTILPALQVILFCLCIGSDPHDLNVSVYDPDDNYSHRFLNELSNKTFKFINHPNFESAVDAVRDGDAWVAMTFHENFTDYVNKRLSLFTILTPDDLKNSKVQLYADMTNYPIQVILATQVVNASVKFARKLIEEIQLPNITNTTGDLPDFETKKQSLTDPYYLFHPPIYGSLQPSFRDFAAAGLILAVILILAVALTALSIVMDRKGGQLERTLIAGVHPIHILIGHLIIQVTIVFLQTLLLLFCVFVLFDIQLKGNFGLVFSLTVFQGIVGMSYGFLISSFCREEQLALFITQGSFYPNLILSGIFWPVEGMPIVLQYISYAMPQTLPIRALRAIISRGWDLKYMTVWLGFVASFGWMLIFNSIAVVIMIYNN